MGRYVYQIEESTFDTRHYVVTTDVPLKDIEGDIIELICHVDITKDGDTTKIKTEDGVEGKVTFVGTEYGDDSQMDWTETQIEGEENG
tara:strand:- start:432 stop:695 length:264 start_codon:yes stop_codon:yes gene_type:complete